MTNNLLTRERLEKIKSWRDAYGAGSNVMLPAEEAEELARMALAAMDNEPVALQPELAKLSITSVTGMKDFRLSGSRPTTSLVGCWQIIRQRNQQRTESRYAASTQSGHRQHSVMSARLAR